MERASGGEVKNSVVLVVGELLDTGLVVVEALLGRLAKVTDRLVVLLARRERLLGPPAVSGQWECEHLANLARAKGLPLEVRVVSGRDPTGALVVECERYAAAHPGALFCLLEAGREGEEGGIARALAGRGLPTASLRELLTSG